MTLARRVAPILQVDPQGELCGRYVRGGMDVPWIEAVARFHVQDGADEIWVRLSHADMRGAGGLFEPIKALERRVFVPLVAWGAIHSPADARLLIGLGAQRVIIDALDDEIDEPIAFVESIAKAVGPDRVSVALLTRRVARRGRVGWELCRKGGASSGHDAVATAVSLANAGAGEIVIQSQFEGLATPDVVVHDADLVDTLLSVMPIQLVSAGNDQEPTTMVTPLLMGADGVATSQLFASGAVTVADAKALLASFGIALRPARPPYTWA